MASKNSAAFEKKFGSDFLSSVPPLPGVYFIRGGSGELIYIGKAKNLRRRLSQYKNAKRRKKHAKMRAIVADAAEIEFRVLASDFEACIQETKLIQNYRPKWNVAGAFYFLYPLLGVSHQDGITRFCYTTQPELFPDFRFHGSYRSRHLVRDAYFSLCQLLAYIGHRIPKGARGRAIPKHSYVIGFRQLPGQAERDWGLFFRGESQEATESLVLALLENAGARSRPEEIQEKLNSLKRFWRHEASPLRRAILLTNESSYPVPQTERDLLFLRWKNARAQARNTGRVPEAAPGAIR